MLRVDVRIFGHLLQFRIRTQIQQQWLSRENRMRGKIFNAPTYTRRHIKINRKQWHCFSNLIFWVIVQEKGDPQAALEAIH
ncbi:hypothetical protein [Acetobacter pomorum]|uniref:hypothetical protein n=1 Tax=Acetobacter pomorum TaxID=65959 RepID=UPI001478AA57|nr:hypothetical protein [Acetobacter pomorum]